MVCFFLPFYNFKVLEERVRPNFDFQNIRLSLRGVIYPQSEWMFEYTLDESDPDAHALKESPKDYALFFYCKMATL